MPTENRSSNTEVVSVPREWLNSVALLQMPLDELQEQAIQHLCEPCDEPAPQHPAPIAWMVGTAFWWTKEEAERDAAETGLPIVGLGPMAGVAPAEQHQGEPVALPERKTDYLSDRAMGWNACLDEIAKLGPLYMHPAPKQGEPVARVEVGADRNACVTIIDNDWLRALKDKATHQAVPLYTHADPAEVERLRLERRKMDQALSACANERDTLRSQLNALEELSRDNECFCVEHGLHIEQLKDQLAEAHALLSSVQAEIYEAAGMASVIREAKPFAISTTVRAPVRKFELGDAISKAGALVERLSSIADALSANAEPSAPVSFQARVQPWLMQCFGEMIAGDREERNHRFLEEALELVQALGATAAEAHQLVDYVFGRAVGEPGQEVGGVMVTLAALCLANGLDMHQLAETELTRIWTKVDAIRAKQASKPQFGPLPGVYPDRKQ
ncbi:hypothetical protein [Pseudomonas putida]|uniref:hypothetical protein n=1 Tax=Pseudomonas putida TaxID=303 RepID=UPI001E34B408|nr:hypothetical protein [Pseudomonas putida]